MKSLYEYLLEEGSEKKKDKSKTKVPPGFVEINMRGNMSTLAKEIIEASGGKLSAKGLASKEAKSKVKDKLKLGDYKGDDSFSETLAKCISNSEPLLQVFGKPEGNDVTDDVIKVKLKGGWENLGGRSNTSSSQRLIKFWLKSLLATFGFSPDKYGYAMQGDVVAVYKK